MPSLARSLERGKAAPPAAKPSAEQPVAARSPSAPTIRIIKGAKLQFGLPLPGYVKFGEGAYMDPNLYDDIFGGLDARQSAILVQELCRAGNRLPTVITSQRYLQAGGNQRLSATRNLLIHQFYNKRGIISPFEMAEAAIKEQQEKGKIQTAQAASLTSPQALQHTALTKKSEARSEDAQDESNIIQQLAFTMPLIDREKNLINATFMMVSPEALRATVRIKNAQLRALYGNRYQLNEDAALSHALVHELGHVLDFSQNKRPAKLTEILKDHDVPMGEQYAQAYSLKVAEDMGFADHVKASMLGDWLTFSQYIVSAPASKPVLTPMQAAIETKLPKVPSAHEQMEYLVKGYASFLNHGNGQHPFATQQRMRDLNELDKVSDAVSAHLPIISEEFKQDAQIATFLDQNRKKFKSLAENQSLTPEEQQKAAIESFKFDADKLLLVAYYMVKNHSATLSPAGQDMLTRLLLAHYIASGGMERREKFLTLNSAGAPKLSMDPVYNLYKKVQNETKGEQDIHNEPVWFTDKGRPKANPFTL